MSIQMKKIGLIVNPKAGHGAEKNLEIARKAVAGLKPVQVITGPGEIGGDAIPSPRKKPGCGGLL